MAFNRKLGFLTAPMLLALGGAAAVTGCGEDGTNPLDEASQGLCCDGFEVGVDMTGADFGVEGDVAVKFEVFAQAMGDLSAVAAATLTDVEVACTNIATDLGATDAELKSANAKKGPEKAKALCALATAQIDAKFSASGEFGASGSLDIDFQEPKCSASVKAQADCNAKCDVNAECDVKANPPTCEGGKLEVSCEGSCEASAEAPSISCTGSCSGTCSGSCKAEVGATVKCEGKCNGTCTASAEGGTDSGIQADGSCKGECDGTCEFAAGAEAQCEGTCEGSCEGSCEATPGSATVKCDGQCNGDFEPLKCSGGELKASCEVDASCDANCNASASAKAECTPPSLNIVFQAEANADIDAEFSAKLDAAINSLKVNLPNLLVAVKARGGGFITGLEASVNAGVDIVADPGDLGVKGSVCFLKAASAGASAVANMKGAVQAAGSVVASGSLGIGG